MNKRSKGQLLIDYGLDHNNPTSRSVYLLKNAKNAILISILYKRVYRFLHEYEEMKWNEMRRAIKMLNDFHVYSFIQLILRVCSFKQ